MTGSSHPLRVNPYQYTLFRGSFWAEGSLQIPKNETQPIFALFWTIVVIHSISVVQILSKSSQKTILDTPLLMNNVRSQTRTAK